MAITSDEKYQAMDDAFANGGIRELDTKVLTEHLIALSNKPIANGMVQHRDIIRGITVNHLLLERHLDGVEKRAETTQKIVLALAAVSVILAGVQIWVAVAPPNYQSTARAQIGQVAVPILAVTKTAVPAAASAPIANAAASVATGWAHVK